MPVLGRRVPRKYITANIEMKAILLQQVAASTARGERDLGASSTTRAAKSHMHSFIHQPVTVADVQETEDTYSHEHIPYSAPDDAAEIPPGLEHRDTLDHAQPSGESRQTSGVVSNSLKSHRQTHHKSSRPPTISAFRA